MGAVLGENIGFEQDGRGHEFLRPVIVIKKFNNEVLWIIPLTKKNKKISAYYFSFLFREDILSLAILSQIRLIDAKRLKYKMGNMTKEDFVLLKEKLKALLP